MGKNTWLNAGIEKLISFIILLFLLLVFNREADSQILAWQLNGKTGSETSVNATTNDANLNTSTLTRGSGLTASSSSNSFSGTNFTASGTKTDAVTNSKFMSFTISAKTGYKVSLSTLDARFRRSSTGPNAFRWQYSTDGTNYTDLGVADISYTLTTSNGDAQTQISLSGVSALQNVANGTTITIRLLGWGASATTGTFGIGKSATTGLTDFSLSIGGTVSATVSAPSVTTTSVSSILSSGATFNGNITSDGGASITERGFCYKTSSGVLITDNKTSEGGTSTGTYSKAFTGLTPATNYFYKAYAVNSAGTTLSGTEISFWTYANEPASYSSVFSCSPVSQTQIDLTFSALTTITDATGYIILQKSGSAPTGLPSDGSSYSTGNTIGDGTVAAIITNTSATSASITGLSAGTNYYFVIIPFGNGSNSATYNYKTDGAVPGTNAMTVKPNDADSYAGTPDIQANPVTISSTADTDAEAVEVFRFNLHDVGADGYMTKVNQITLNAGLSNTANWTNTIQGVKVSTDGGSSFVTTGTVTINSSSLVIPVTTGNLDVSNGSIFSVSVFIYLKTSGLTDNQVIQFNIPTTSHGFTADATGSTFASTFPGAVTGNTVKVDVTATKFNFSTQPSNTTVNTVFSAGVESVDGNGNRDLDYTGGVTLSSSTGSLSSATGLTQNLVYGVYSWSDLQDGTAGTGITLTANGVLTLATSSAFRLLSAQPTIQASSILFSSITQTSMTISWTNGNGSNRIVVVKASGTPGTPVNGTNYNANTVFGSGDTLRVSEYIVYNGTGNSVTVTGLTGSTTYTVKVFEYNGSSGTQNYLTTSNATSQATNGLSYYSTGTGDPTLTSSWKTNRDGTGTSPSGFTSGETFVIQNGHTMTTSTTWSISGTNSKLWIESGGTLVATSSVTLATATVFQIDNGGTYVHSNTAAFGTTIFQGTESFASNSTVEFRDWASTGPSVSTWGNVKFNATGSVASSLQFSGALTTINGNLEIIATGTGTVREVRLSATTGFTLNILGNLVISGGILSEMSGSPAGSVNAVINVGGDFNMTGGTFTAGTNANTNASVNFTGSNKTFTFSGGTLTNDKISWTVNSGASLTLNNDVTVATGRTLTVSGNLDFGTKSVTGAGAFTLNSTGTLKTSNASGFSGAVAVSGTKTFAPSAAYEINGASTGSLVSTFNNLSINNSGGDVSLSTGITVNGTLSFTNGKLLLGNNNLVLGSNAAFTGLTNSKYVVTNGTGTLTRNNVGNNETLFPVGTSAAFSPAWITNSGTAGNYSVSVIPDSSGTNNGADRVKLKWDVSGPASGSNTKLRIGWLISQEGSNFAANRNAYGQIYHFYNNTWVLAGTSYLTGGLPEEIVDYTVYTTGITSYSPFGTGQNQSAMPVTLASFSSSVNTRNIKLNWVTENEINNAGFEIQRAEIKDNVKGEWHKIGYVNGSGTKTSNTSYSFDDRNLQTAKYSYRLKQVDLNGNYEFFELNGVPEIGLPLKFAVSQNFPNPFNPATKINIDLPADSKVSVTLYDVSGREVARILNGDFRKAGYHTETFNAGFLSSGIYFYRVVADKYSDTKKMALIK